MDCLKAILACALLVMTAVGCSAPAPLELQSARMQVVHRDVYACSAPSGTLMAVSGEDATGMPQVRVVDLATGTAVAEVEGVSGSINGRSLTFSDGEQVLRRRLDAGSRPVDAIVSKLELVFCVESSSRGDVALVESYGPSPPRVRVSSRSGEGRILSLPKSFYPDDVYWLNDDTLLVSGRSSRYQVIEIGPIGGAERSTRILTDVRGVSGTDRYLAGITVVDKPGMPAGVLCVWRKGETTDPLLVISPADGWGFTDTAMSSQSELYAVERPPFESRGRLLRLPIESWVDLEQGTE